MHDEHPEAQVECGRRAFLHERDEPERAERLDLEVEDVLQEHLHAEQEQQDAGHVRRHLVEAERPSETGIGIQQGVVRHGL